MLLNALQEEGTEEVGEVGLSQSFEGSARRREGRQGGKIGFRQGSVRVETIL